MAIKFYEPSGEYGWLANFSEHAFELDGERWPTVEHYFQASKFADRERQRLIRIARSALDAKRLAQGWSDDKRRDWHDIRDQVMYRAITAKFEQHLALAAMLVATGDEVIEEAAADDAYWGTGADGSGQSRMGQLLMTLRLSLATTRNW